MNNINWIKVISSNLNKVAYDSNNSVLYVWFKSGWIYMYRGVSLKIYNDLLNAPSKGKFLDSYIKGVYPYHRLR